MLDPAEYLKIFISLLVIVDPLGAVPLFLTLTVRNTGPERRAIARTAAFGSAAVFVVTILVGKSILTFFGISIASFKVGGGIILLFMALEMMEARQVLSKHTPEEDREAEYREEIAVVPLSIPILCGPGALSSLIIYADSSRHPAHLAALSFCCIGITAAIWVSLLLADRVSLLLGKTGINIVIRLMGLIVAAISVEFIAGGLATLLPGLGG
jgi:multiple antibiotic resistance protein